MASAAIYERIKAEVDKRAVDYIAKLAEVVAIPSVSSDVSYRNHVHRMADWLEAEMKRLGVSVTPVQLGTQMIGGREVDLPPILLGSYGDDFNKKTLLVYGHYDVQPAFIKDGWNTDPWKLTEHDGRLFGRGSTDDKAPIISWLFVIELHKAIGIEVPVNLRICFEGMEESDSVGLDECVRTEADKYFKGVDAVCISDNYWLGKSKPCLTYGLRGISYFYITISGPGRDLHSGVFGGSVHEPMTDLVHIMGSLVSAAGKIQIDGIYDEVAPVTDDERKTYEGIDFCFGDYHSAIGAKNTIFNDEQSTLMARWRYPSLSLHGIEGAFSGPGSKTVIPAKVIGKFSIRSVPHMKPDRIFELVKAHCERQFAMLKSKNRMQVVEEGSGSPWLANPNHWNFLAGRRAVNRVFGVEPDLTREGGSIPVTLTFQEALEKNVLLLPMGACDDGAHSVNEKIDRRNYIEGIKLLSIYLHELAAVQAE